MGTLTVNQWVPGSGPGRGALLQKSRLEKFHAVFIMARLTALSTLHPAKPRPVPKDGVSCIMPVYPPKIGTVDGQAEPAGNAISRYISFFNMTGHPPIILPCSMLSAGLPIAAQLIGTASLIEPSCDFKLLVLAFN
jgi:hypothetical protein